MADGSDVAPLIHQTSGKTCALGVKRRNFSLSVILGVLLVSAVVYFVAQVVFPFAIIRSEQGEYHNHYDRPLFNLPNWLDRGENDTKNKSSTTYGSVREEESVIQVVQVTQRAGVGKELQLDSNCTNNNPDLKSTTAQLYVLSKEEADKTGAYCLDGSPPAYYFKKVSAVVYFVAQVVFPFAIIRSEQGEYHNHYDRPLFNLPNWLDRGENDTKNKSSTTYGSVREEESVIQVVQVTQGAGVGKELQLDSNCTNNKPDLKDEVWQCAYPENLVPYEPVPLFMLNYLYDVYALKFILGTTCYPDQCQGKDLAAVQNYRTSLLKVAHTELREQDGAFLITCFSHGLAGIDVVWTEFTVNNRTVRQAVGDWYFGRTADNVHVDTDPEMNPVCRKK
uniref:Uncharacterized protein n=1 Tax=Branchiostoma floridae TaxID=7739 RepID=C3ZME7_BRAFL|eukprot:XP_002590392.1 hypothetical protein BRAFLDRAFT_76666 [Branchiostoma floridae]